MSATPDILLICGMHRSGTSALAEACYRAGFSIADDRVADDSQVNSRGFWEDRLVVELNEQILETLGLHWSSVSPLPPDWLQRTDITRLMSAAVSHLQASYATRLPAVIKDPRLCRLLPFWLSAAEQCGWTAGCLLALRAPQAVAASLAQRDGLPESQAALLWSVYMQEAVLHSTDLPRRFVDYDAVLENGPARLLTALTELGFSCDGQTEALSSVIDNNLRHHRNSGGEPVSGIGQKTQALYQQYLSAEGTSSHSPAAHKLDAADPLTVVDALTQALLASHREQFRIGQLHEHALSTIDERDQQLQQRNREYDHAESIVVQRDKDLQIARHEHNLMNEQLISVSEQLTAVSQELKKHAEALEWSDGERRNAARYINTLEHRIRELEARWTALAHSVPGRLAIHWLNRQQPAQRDSND